MTPTTKSTLYFTLQAFAFFLLGIFTAVQMLDEPFSANVFRALVFGLVIASGWGMVAGLKEWDKIR